MASDLFFLHDCKNVLGGGVMIKLPFRIHMFMIQSSHVFSALVFWVWMVLANPLLSKCWLETRMLQEAMLFLRDTGKNDDYSLFYLKNCLPQLWNRPILHPGARSTNHTHTLQSHLPASCATPITPPGSANTPFWSNIGIRGGRAQAAHHCQGPTSVLLTLPSLVQWFCAPFI